MECQGLGRNVQVSSHPIAQGPCVLFNARSSRTARGAGRLERTLRGEIEARVVLAARHLHQAHQGVEEVVVREVLAFS